MSALRVEPAADQEGKRPAQLSNPAEPAVRVTHGMVAGTPAARGMRCRRCFQLTLAGPPDRLSSRTYSSRMIAPTSFASLWWVAC